MMFPTKLIAILATLSATTLAADVYSHFYDSNQNSLTDTNFDVSNGGCFVVSPAALVSFSQANAVSNAQGPYCISGYTDGSCGTLKGRQQFQDVETASGTAASTEKYELISSVADAGSYTWSAASCP